MPLDESADSPILFKNAKAFDAWLKKHHATSTGLWLKLAKRGADEASVTYLEAVDIALCWGWIDSQKKALDAQHFLQRIAQLVDMLGRGQTHHGGKSEGKAKG